MSACLQLEVRNSTKTIKTTTKLRSICVFMLMIKICKSVYRKGGGRERDKEKSIWEYYIGGPALND